MQPELVLTLPLVEIAAAAVPVAIFVSCYVQVAKVVGLRSRAGRAAVAIVLGQAISDGYWAAAGIRVPTAAFYAVLVGLAATAIAMGLWEAALKRSMESVNSPDKPPDN